MTFDLDLQVKVTVPHMSQSTIMQNLVTVALIITEINKNVSFLSFTLIFFTLTLGDLKVTINNDLKCSVAK